MALKILAFGDSIAWGAWDSKGGWIDRLKQYLSQETLKDKKWRFIQNLGISGETTKRLLKRFDNECKARINLQKTYHTYVIIIAIGLNNSRYNNITKDSIESSKSEFACDLKALIEIAQRYTKNIVFVGTTPTDNTKTMPVWWKEEQHFVNESSKEYNEVIKKVTKEQNILFFDMYEAMSKESFQEMLEDGVHPNAKGHEFMNLKIKEFLIKNKLIE